MPTVAVDKAALFKELGKEFVQSHADTTPRNKLTEALGTQPKSSTSYASSSVCASLGPVLSNH